MKRDGLTRQDLQQSLITDKRVFVKLQQDILEEQNRREASLGSEPFISDRGLDPLVYIEQQCVKAPGEELIERLVKSQATQECIQRYRHSLVVILSPLHQPTDDGVRLVPSQKEQIKFTELTMTLLDKYQVPFIYIKEKDHRQRMECLEQAVYRRTLPFDPETINQLTLSVSFPSSDDATPTIPTIEVLKNTAVLTTTTFDSGKSNRMIDRYGPEQFAMISFHCHILPTTVRTVLNKGVRINGVEYQFLGCSSSGLKQRKCYLYRGDASSTEAILKECGSFSVIKSVSKQLKRIAQLFSAAVPTGVEIREELLSIKDDIETSAGNFTDGCGLVSESVAKRVMSGCGIELPSASLPSVYQIRYEGCKGIVVRDPSLPKDSMMVRKSMKKFNPGSRPFHTMWLCDFSKPYNYGYLNKQFIILFSALGVKDEVFLKKQAEHFERVERMTKDCEVAIEMLGMKHPNLAISLVQQPNDIHKGLIQKELKLLRSKSIEKMDKLRILIPESRNIFGVCDPLSVLCYGECFVRPTICGEPHTLSGFVTVSKNPCYLLGDVRVLKAVCDERTIGLEHLVDCIVFPVNGRRPHPSEIAGSDLDGDMYFVCWDSELIVPQVVEPYDYPSTEAPVTSQVVTSSMRIDFLSRQNKESRTMGKIDRYFNYWASIKGAGCDECVTLGKLFSRSVDASKTGDTVPIPGRLRLPEEHDRTSSKAVWIEMERRATSKKQELQETVAQDLLLSDEVPSVSESFIWTLIQEESSSLSEFELFRVAQRWCLAHDSDDTDKLVEFCRSINFGKLTIDQQIAVIDVGIPQDIVTNALNKSKLLSAENLRYFSLDSSQQEWRQYFHCSSSDFDWQHMLRALERNTESLIIFRLPDSVVIALHFLRPLQIGFSDLPEGSVIAYFISESFRFKRRHVLGQGYNLHLNSDLLQIYRNNDKHRTFLWLRNEIETKGCYPDETLIFDRLSVDLITFKRDIISSDKHPKVNKQVFLEIEVFVKKGPSDPTYFDVYIADQWDTLYPEVVDTTEDIEDVPCEVQVQDLDNAILPSGELSDNVFKEWKGSCALFLSAIGRVSIADRAYVVEDALLGLLTKLHVSYGHTAIDRDTGNTLQQILNNLTPLFVRPCDCILLLERLCWLNIPTSLLEHVGSLVLSKIEMTDFSTYLEVIHLQWKKWCVIPNIIAYQMAQSLHVLCQSLLVVSPKSPVHSLSSLDEHLTSSQDQVDDDLHLKRYVCYFMHRMLIYFLEDVRSQLDSKQEVNNKIIMLKPSLDGADTSKHMRRINFHRTSNIHVHSSELTIGSHVFIAPMKAQRMSSFFPVALGRIASITKTPPDIVLEVDKPVPECILKSAELGQGHWELRLIGNVTIFNRSLNALMKLANSKTKPTTDLLSMLVHPHSFTHGTEQSQLHVVNSFSKLQPATLTLPLHSFNDSQQQAIDAALRQRLTLIHGPPGTGKTHVACGIVQQVLQCGLKVLVAAETNMAVDNLVRRLLQNGIQVVRVGTLQQISPDIRHASLDEQINKKRLETGRDKSKGPFLDVKLARDILHYAQVIATTCAGAGDLLLEKFEIPFVLIDEATLVIEPVSLIPIVLKSQQLVLIGDPQQLSPHMPGVRQGLEVDDLSMTLFHRFRAVFPSFFLEEQHRMHPSLAKFPSEIFYKGKLKSAACLQEREPFHIAWIESDKPSVFIDVSNQSEKRLGTSYCNYAEANVIVQVIKSLLNNEVSPLEVTVLTPYIGQVKCIKEKLTLLNDKVQVSTVDRFQGQENDVIVFSTVRCNSHSSLGFTDDQYRMNVLLTRARRCLIGIGCVETLQNGSKLWGTWIEQTKVLCGNDFMKLTECPVTKRQGGDSLRLHQSQSKSHSRKAAHMHVQH